MSKSLKELQSEIIAARERWGFSEGSIANLLVGLAAATGETISAVSKEHIWMTRAPLPAGDKSSVAHEIADVAIYLVALCDRLGVDLEHAVESKMALNDARFPKK
jgi:NTP pyrophosphatase (non-canonical NTP hydrolase)